MEQLLGLLMKDAQASKFYPIRKSCQNALDILKNKENMDSLPAYVLREKCLEPLQMALDTKTKRLMTHAVSGIEKLLKDGRFQSSIEAEEEDRWLPIQILKTVYSTPNLPEDIQVDVMKLLLKMTFTTAWCMNSRIITQVVQVYIDTFCVSSANLRAVIQAALTQLLGSFADKLSHSVRSMDNTSNDVMSDFNAKGNASVESLTDDVVTLLHFLVDRLLAAQKAGQTKQALPLILEGIYAILTNSPRELRNNFGFQQLVWQNLCPTLISLLGLPKAEVKQKSSGDAGRTMECPGMTPSTVKIIYSISVKIAQMVGPVRSLRPVLESLFHRILICPPPQHRHDAIKALKELLACPETVCDLTVTYCDDVIAGKSPTQCNDMALINMIVTSIQECCHTGDSGMCYTSVTCINDLLTSIEHLHKGTGIHDDGVMVIKQKYHGKKGKCRSQSERSSSVASQDDGELSIHSNINNQQVSGDHDHTNTHNATGSHDNQINGTTTESNTADTTAQTNQITKSTEKSVNENTKISEDETMNTKSESKQKDTSLNDNHHSKTKTGSFAEIEDQSASQYIEKLTQVLPYLFALTTIPELDEALQKFSSNFSDDISTKEASYSKCEMLLSTVLNGDSIYSTTYAALSLNLHLNMAGFYDTREKTLVSMSQRQFIDSILDTEMFLYLSPAWLGQVYNHVLGTDLITQAGGSCDDGSALITALKDIDGHRSHAIAGQMLRESVLTGLEEDSGADNSDLTEAGQLLCRQILVTCWDTMLDVLSVLLTGRGVGGVTNTLAIIIGTDGAKEEGLRKREALCKCLDGLQKAAKLCCSLGLQERCTAVFALLANTSCVMEDFKHATQTPHTDRGGQKTSIIPQSKPKLVRLHASHVLSMDAMITTGLEIGSHSAECWKHVLRCCAFISELEHTYFSGGNNQSSLPKIHQEHTQEVTEDCDADIYGIPMAPVVPVAPRINVSNLITQSSIESGWDRSITGGGVLNSVQASQALCGLSQEVDRLFEEAANNLNMTALTSFLSNLCEASKHQLQKLSRRLMEEEDHVCDIPVLPVNSLHLYRLHNVLMKVAHSDRPLLHLIKAWSVVSSYLVESAGHKDRSVSKMSVTCVHDYIVAVMSSQAELKHFHTNEMLCKTFENILCLELCDGDVQDQIVCSICELVEASAADVKSGWRPLFGALRAVRIEYTTIEEVNQARQRHIEAVLDVFDVYLNTDNILVFASAMVDCILCLLKYVRGPGEFDDSDSDDTDSMSDYVGTSPPSENLCIPALQYLKQCSIILQSMWNMPACPVFHGAKRIQVNTSHRCVDPNIPNMNFKKFSKYFTTDDEQTGDDTTLDVSPQHGSHVQYSHMHEISMLLTEGGDASSLQSNDSGIMLTTNKEVDQVAPAPSVDLVSLDELDNHTGILHVWFLLLEGLSGAISACPKSFQPHTMETMFELLRSASHVPGPKFGMYSMNHLLLPMIQSWLRCGSKKFGYWDTGATNFKQCCGHTTDLVVELIHDFKEDRDISPLLRSVLSQLLIVLTECVAQPFEVISRLGCSCIRHVLLSGSGDFSEEMWQIMIDGLQNALDVTTYCVRQLMLLFKANSENFYGDIGQVKVFLLDSQVSVEVPVVDKDEDKSYVFLLYPPGYENSLNPDHILARVPFRSVVVGLLSHQLLLQTVGCILLEGNDKTGCTIPGLLCQISTCHVSQLLDCLWQSYRLACDFDLRPGLKFLVQKVAHTQVAVNLYKQAGASMVFYIHTLLKICSNMPGLTLQSVRTLLKGNKKGATSNAAENMPNYDGDNDIMPKGNNCKDMPKGNNCKDMPKGNSCKETDISIGCDGDNDIHRTKDGKHLEITDEVAKEDELSENNDASTTSADGTCSLTETLNNDAAITDNNPCKIKEQNSCTKKPETAKNKSEKLIHSLETDQSLYLAQLQSVCDELCQTYIDILYDKEGTSCVDNMGEQQLFFLIAQPDEFPELQHTKLDVEQLSSQLEQTQARLQGEKIHTQIVTIQGEDDPSPAVVRSETEPVLPPLNPLPPLSPLHTQEKSKREMRNDSESRVYNLATDKLIKNLMTEYKKRKNQHAMPTFSKVTKKEGREKTNKKKCTSTDPVEQVIEQQQHTSIMKDSEAHLQSWTELLCSILGLFQQLDDDQFTRLLPTVFGCVNHLVCHAQDMRLREDLAQWLHRVGGLFTLSVDA